MKRNLIVASRRFGKICWSVLQIPLKMVLIDCSETTVNIHTPKPLNIPEEWMFHLNSFGSLKYWTIFRFSHNMRKIGKVWKSEMLK